MKKLLLFIFVLAIVGFTTSCGKKCTCVTKVDGKKVSKNVATEFKAWNDYFKESELNCKNIDGKMLDKNDKEVKVETKCK